MRWFFIFTFTVVTITFSQKAALANVCDNARSSADVMKCLTAQKKDVQGVLNTVFDKTSQARSGEDLAALKKIQTEWLSYRDQQCDMEAASAETETQKREENLRCLLRITDERITALSKVAQDDEQKLKLQSRGPPRWMNALSKDNPGIFWRYGSRLKGDLDCDGTDEFVMSGMGIDAKTARPYAIVAISENPETGRPTSTLIRMHGTKTIMPVEGEEEPEILQCGYDIKMGFVDVPPAQGAALDMTDDASIQGAEVPAPRCLNALSVTDNICEAAYISFSDGQYLLSYELESEGALQ